MQSADRAGRIIHPAGKHRFFRTFPPHRAPDTRYGRCERAEEFKLLTVRRVEVAGFSGGMCAQKSSDAIGSCADVLWSNAPSIGSTAQKECHPEVLAKDLAPLGEEARS